MVCSQFVSFASKWPEKKSHAGLRLLYFILCYCGAYWQINKLLIKIHSADHIVGPLGPFLLVIQISFNILAMS